MFNILQAIGKSTTWPMEEIKSTSRWAGGMRYIITALFGTLSRIRAYWFHVSTRTIMLKGFAFSSGFINEENNRVMY
jgi:hypothetical protein